MPARTTLFYDNGSQAVRLPETVAFPASVKNVAILVDGPRRIVVPYDAGWDAFFDSPGVELGPRNQPLLDRDPKW